MAPALVFPTPPPELEEAPFRPARGLDLPALYTGPPVDELLAVLNGLALAPVSWEEQQDGPKRDVDPPGLSKWLTGVISSKLKWIHNEEVKEAVWEAASRRLAERCGRMAMPSQTRTFRIPLPSSKSPLELSLYEPTLTADNLGLKTWASSYLLSKRLPAMALPPSTTLSKGLELGAGTGLVGLTAAALFEIPVLLTDLPEIVPNLQRNANANPCPGVTVSVMDWRDGVDECVPEGAKYDLVLAADPLYSPEHPALVVGMVKKWLVRSARGRAVVEMPLRSGYSSEREEFRNGMEGVGLSVMSEGVESGVDDWGAGGEVECWWSVWGWKGEGVDGVGFD